MGNKPIANGSVRVLAISDVHSDEGENWEYLEEHFGKVGIFTDKDVLIVAGDISSDLTIVEGKQFFFFNFLFFFLIIRRESHVFQIRLLQRVLCAWE